MANSDDVDNATVTAMLQTETQIEEWKSEISQFAGELRRRISKLKQSIRYDHGRSRIGPDTQRPTNDRNSSFEKPRRSEAPSDKPRCSHQTNLSRQELSSAEISAEAQDPPIRLAQLKQRLAKQLEESQRLSEAQPVPTDGLAGR